MSLSCRLRRPGTTERCCRSVPALVLTVYVVRVNVAVTFLAESSVTEHVPVPAHAPLQPAKTEPADAVAVSVTDVPALNGLDPAPLMPDGALPTVPLPVPSMLTVSVFCTGSSWKFRVLSAPDTIRNDSEDDVT